MSHQPATKHAAPDSATPAERAAHVETILARIESLPTLSPIATRLLALTSADDSDFDEIIALIEADLSMTTRMLALCRRAALGLGGTVTTVRRAVVLLGLEAVQSAVLSVSVFDVLTGPAALRMRGAGAPARFDRVGFWQHSLAVACASELLARQHPELKIRPDEAFTAGLLHDVGKVALEWILPQTYPGVVSLAESRSCDLATAERSILGLDHHVAGKHLAEHWGLPYILGDTMWLHGQPAAALPDVPHRSLICLVTAADAQCRRLHLGWSGNYAQVEPVEAVAESAGLQADRMLAIEPRLHEALAQRCADLGLADLTSPELMMQSIASANARLHRLTQSLARRAQLARRQASVLDLVGAFLARAQQAASVDEALAAIAWSFARFAAASAPASPAAPPTPVTLVFQPRPGEPWVIYQTVQDGTLGFAKTTLAPKAHDAKPASLAVLATDNSIGAAADLLTWMQSNVDASAPALDVRRMKRLPVVTPDGAAAIVLHDRDLPEPPRGCAVDAAGGHHPLQALINAWSWAISAAVRQAGSRRLSEALAHANRALVDAQRKLTETESLTRLGELTAGAAHEMNNPLTIISGRSQLLAQRLPEGRDRDDACAVAQAASRLTGLISSLHTLARPPAPKLAAVNIRDLLEVVAKRAKARFAAETGDSTLPSVSHVRLSIGSPMELAALDAELIGRAVEELLVNALQASPRTQVEIAAAAELAQDRLTLTVKDDGCGMSAHAVAHAFDPFFSERPAGRSTGLGLAIARRFVTLHGGEISLRSQAEGPSRGTSVVITLTRWRHGRQKAAAPKSGASVAA